MKQAEKVNDAIIEVLEKENTPLSVKDIFIHIVTKNLYRFDTSTPEQVVRTALRRHSDSHEFASSSENKIYTTLEDGRYWLLNKPLPKSEDVSFSVDAGIINRLGFELVSRSETAVSELIKNAFDADANKVDLHFYHASKQTGGRLEIDDDGLGMTRNQLVNGFMRLATTDKLHNPLSEKYKRPKAGKKGIGRFATQRLGEKLTIITQTFADKEALRLTISWNSYEADKDVTEIKNILESVEKTKENGTTLIIEGLRDIWREIDIKRVYRYVSELIQPNLLKISNESVIQENKVEAFDVKFYEDEKKEPIVDAQTMVLDKAILTISGYIDKDGFGYCSVTSPKFNLSDTLKISSIPGDKVFPFEDLTGSNILFKAYYFIGGDRAEYYYQNIGKLELKGLIDNLKKNGGIKVYRNGFKVSPYGDRGDDWLEFSSKSRIGEGVPFSNTNFIGFVQLNEVDKTLFEEVAGREGIIAKDSFKSLKTFVSSAIIAGYKNFLSVFKNSPEFKEANKRAAEPVTKKTVDATIVTIQKAVNTLTSPDKNEDQKSKAQNDINKAVDSLVRQTNSVVGELEMLRVLAGVGLTIGEFIHEVKQFTPSFSGFINSLLSKSTNEDVKTTLNEMLDVFTSFQSYTAYFDSTISQNVIRELQPIDLRDAIRTFEKIVKADLGRRRIEIKTEYAGWDLITGPMHVSEWNTILQNLYSNAKKAIIRSGVAGKILIRCFKDEKSVYMQFYDNGDGINITYKDRIFDAFYTTSTPVAGGGSSDDVAGTGLGLYILKQIIINRNGRIWVDEGFDIYNTCISVQLPLG